MLTTMKVYVCYAFKIYKNKPKQFSSHGARAQCAVPGSAFEYKL